MFTLEEHLDDLYRHLNHVEDSTRLLGERLIADGQVDLGRLLMYRGRIHDASKFHAIEWDFLHVGDDVDPDKLRMAITQHAKTNSHHPEFHGGIDRMPAIDTAEMVCDWHARSKEHGTNLREWIRTEARPRFKCLESNVWTLIADYVNLLLKSSFRKDVAAAIKAGA